MNRIFNLKGVKHIELANKKEKFSESGVLTDLLGFRKIFVHQEIIPSGRRNASPHYHAKIEEMFLVLSGKPSIHVENKSKQLRPGDFIGFKPNGKKKYFIENKTSSKVKILVICSNDKEDKVKY